MSRQSINKPIYADEYLAAGGSLEMFGSDEGFFSTPQNIDQTVEEAKGYGFLTVGSLIVTVVIVGASAIGRTLVREETTLDIPSVDETSIEEASPGLPSSGGSSGLASYEANPLNSVNEGPAFPSNAEEEIPSSSEFDGKPFNFKEEDTSSSKD